MIHEWHGVSQFAVLLLMLGVCCFRCLSRGTRAPVLMTYDFSRGASDSVEEYLFLTFTKCYLH